MKLIIQSGEPKMHPTKKPHPSFRMASRISDASGQSPAAQNPVDEIHEPENHKQAFRAFVRMMADHLTNGKMTAYTFYY